MVEKVGARAELAWFVHEVVVLCYYVNVLSLGLRRHYAYFVHPEELSAGKRANSLLYRYFPENGAGVTRRLKENVL